MLDYGPLHEGVFLRRPNRFTAWVLLDGRETMCHVKNTGRLRELLLPGAWVRCRYEAAPGRKTQWTLLLVWQDGWVCLDSQAPNLLARQWVQAGGLGFVPQDLRPEQTCGDSRLDLAFTHEGRCCWMEVKGVTLLQDGVAHFPDAPTQRGIRHLQTLCRMAQTGQEAYVLFVIQRQGAHCFTPNRANGPEFAEALQAAVTGGVQPLAVDCVVSETGIRISGRVPVHLEEQEETR